MDETTREKMSMEIETMNIIKHLDLTDIYRTPNPTAAAYTFFSSAHRSNKQRP